MPASLSTAGFLLALVLVQAGETTVGIVAGALAFAWEAFVSFFPSGVQ